MCIGQKSKWQIFRIVWNNFLIWFFEKKRGRFGSFSVKFFLSETANSQRKKYWKTYQSSKKKLLIIASPTGRKKRPFLNESLLSFRKMIWFSSSWAVALIPECLSYHFQRMEFYGKRFFFVKKMEDVPIDLT